MRVYFEVCDLSLPYGDPKGTYLGICAESADIGQLVPQMSAYNKSDIQKVKLYVHSKSTYDKRVEMFNLANRRWQEHKKQS